MRAFLRRWALLGILAAITAAGGYFAGYARASYQISTTDPAWSFDAFEIEKQVAQFAKTNGVTTQTAWTTFINGLGSTGSIEVSKGILRAVKCSVP